jgi:pSer/pThr/pTyr-binding forkhead associated (FHA) protein
MAGEKLDFTGHIDPRLIVEQSPIVPAGVVFPLSGWITVGRASSSDIVLDEHFVSSTHARFVPRGSFYYVEDLGSTNGTFVNEKQVSGEARLKLDSRVRVGETVFRYEE